MDDLQIDGNVFGMKIEVPTPLFAQGLLFRLFSTQVEDRYLCLPAGREDGPGAYVRCAKPPKKTEDAITTLDGGRVHEEYGLSPTKIAQADVVRLLPLCRSRVDQSYMAYLSGVKERTVEQKVALDFGSYLFSVWQAIEINRDPGLTYQIWMSRCSEEAQVRMREVLETGLLDRCLELHARHYLPRS